MQNHGCGNKRRGEQLKLDFSVIECKNSSEENRTNPGNAVVIQIDCFSELRKRNINKQALSRLLAYANELHW